MGFSLPHVVSGLADATPLFLVAVGLSIVFAVTRTVNLAQGAFYMLGAYFAAAGAGRLLPGGTGTSFWLVALLAAAATGVLGAAMEVLVLRRLYRAPQLYTLLAGLGALLVVRDLAPRTWGTAPLAGPPAAEVFEPILIAGARLTGYDLVLAVLGPLALAALLFLVYATRWGALVQAATEDREMLAALGVRQKLLSTSVVFLGTALAGLGGALQLPREAAAVGMDLDMTVLAFMAVVVGGMGSIPGAFLAAEAIALLRGFGVLVLPDYTMAVLFLVVALALIFRPQGLLGGRTVSSDGPADVAARPLAPAAGPVRAVLWAVLAALLALPFAARFIGGEAILVVVSEVLILALFAASLQFLIGLGGMAAFGHAAYLGLGAYAAALVVRQYALPTETALLVAPFAAVVAGLLFGWLCLRRPGAYVALMTLLVAQLVWSAAVQWRASTTLSWHWWRWPWWRCAAWPWRPSATAFAPPEIRRTERGRSVSTGRASAGRPSPWPAASPGWPAAFMSISRAALAPRPWPCRCR
jgi:branched-chain amino acid transport system permease protein